MKKKPAKAAAPAVRPPAFRAGLSAALVLTAVFCVLIFFNIILKLDTFHWDEAHHAFYGLQLAQSLQRGDCGGFWAWTDRQALWPFFHSWLLTVFFLLFGFSEAAARSLSLLFYGLTALLLYLTAERLSKTDGWKIGLLAAGFFLTGPLTLSFASQNMLEGLGALEFALAVYLALVAEDRRQPAWYLAVGAVLALTLVTKYNYALLVVGSFGLYLGFQLLTGLKKWRDWLWKPLFAFGPLLPTALVWFLSGDSARKLQMVLLSQDVSTKQDIMPSFWSNLAFYPNAIAHDYFFSAWLGALALLALLPLAAKKYPRAVLPYLSVWTSLLILLTVVGTKMNRLFYPAIPFVYLLLAVWLVSLLGLARQRFALSGRAAAALLALMLLPAALGLPRLGRMLLAGDINDISHGLKVSAPADRYSNVLNFYHDSLPRDRSVATGLSGGRLSPYLFYFYFRDWQAPFYSLFQAGAPGFGQADFLLDLAQTGAPQPALIDQDALAKWHAYTDQQLRSGRYYLYKEQAWPGLGVTARILARQGLNLLQKSAPAS